MEKNVMDNKRTTQEKLLIMKLKSVLVKCKKDH